MEEQFSTPDSVGDSLQKPWIVSRYRDSDGNIWFELSLSLLVQDQEFLHVGL
jgi:hypothetical protein